MKSSQRLLAQLSDPTKGAAAELTLTMAALRQTLAHVDSTFTSPGVVAARNQADTLVRNLSQMTAQFRVTGARLDSVLARIQEGQGTIGKFATDTALYTQATRLTAQLDSLVQDLREHPGRIGVTVKMF
jgi:phospholipid/cholesterol/gamma-HCH transport system substrate-binding protein